MRNTAPVASGGPRGVPDIQASSSPFVAQVRWGLGGENCLVVSHHGYVRARRTSPAWPRSPGEDRVATWEIAPTGVERELKSTGGLRLACGRRQSGGMAQPGLSRGWDLRGLAPFFAGAGAFLKLRLALSPR